MKINIIKIFALFSFVIFSYISYAQIIVKNLNKTLIGEAFEPFDLDEDENFDLEFSIRRVQAPPPLNVLVALYEPMTNKIRVLDNSNIGYPDALDEGDSVVGNFTPFIGVLGTFSGAGNFNGKGIKYLGFILIRDNGVYYGWIKLYCSEERDTLIIYQYGIRTDLNEKILAGQTEITKTSFENIPYNLSKKVNVYPNPFVDRFTINFDDVENVQSVRIYNMFGSEVYKTKNIPNNNILDVELDKKTSEILILQVETEKGIIRKKILSVN
ncbi:MAG: T9SS type A sorting domain-containing protein [Bacteroidia bacterium]